MLKQLISVSLAALMLTACSTDQYGNPQMNKQNIGTAIGGIGGAVAGAQFGRGWGQLAAGAAGGLLGAALGNSIGASLDRADMAYYNQTSQNALENARSGQTLPWRNPDSGHSGTITPSNVYQTSGGQYCREYQQTITVGGQTKRGYGTACRQPDGSWQIAQ
jgi:surface antigen